MADKKLIEEKMQIPEGITISASNTDISVSGPKGKVEKNLSLRNLKISVDGKEVKLSGPMRELNTAKSHINNMFQGCKDGFEAKMKVVYAHFPMSIAITGKQLSIKNFIGEKQPRFANIVGDTKVVVKGAEVTINGPNKEDVGQTVANIRKATKIRNLDSRIFQDGIYTVK